MDFINIPHRDMVHLLIYLRQYNISITVKYQSPVKFHLPSLVQSFNYHPMIGNGCMSSFCGMISYISLIYVVLLSNGISLFQINNV